MAHRLFANVRDELSADTVGLDPVGALAFAFLQDVVGVGSGNITDNGLVHAVAGHSLQLYLAVQRDLEVEDLVADQLSNLAAVGVQGDLVAGGVDLHIGGGLVAVHIALGADMDEGSLGPVGLVQIEGILLDLTVEGHQALVVHASLAALVTGVSGKVEHIPNMGG